MIFLKEFLKYPLRDYWVGAITRPHCCSLARLTTVRDEGASGPFRESGLKPRKFFENLEDEFFERESGGAFGSLFEGRFLRELRT
jgi:hypothetical protein